jgi:hypothetical protein
MDRVTDVCTAGREPCQNPHPTELKRVSCDADKTEYGEWADGSPKCSNRKIVGHARRHVAQLWMSLQKASRDERPSIRPVAAP